MLKNENKLVSETNDTKKEKGFLGRLKERLSKTRGQLVEGLARTVLGKKNIDDALFEELETQLLISDIGLDATRDIIENLTRRVSRKQLKDSHALYDALRENLIDLLEPCDIEFSIEKNDRPVVIMMVGVNGVGKTTTIGKLAKHYQAEGKSVMLAAADTFRAAAVEQLQEWGTRNDITVISQQKNADPSAVVFDALQAATARKKDILIIDTAGRLHTKSNLMNELEKMKRVLGKIDPGAPHETMIVIDATTGQNALEQAVQFHNSVGLSGITLTKLDGTAKGGIIFAIAKKLALPIRYIGVGEGIDDMREFNAESFVSALFSNDESEEQK